jgi:adenylosuccinate synthase
MAEGVFIAVRGRNRCPLTPIRLEPTMTSHANPSHSAPAPHGAVVGLQWGDEGKGKVVDLLTSDYDLIVRYNGGANAGHTVVVGDQRYALHLLPSGILNPDKVSVISNGVVIDPAKLLEEIDSLTARGIAIHPDNLAISDRAHIVLPYHKQADALLETAMGRARGEGKNIGTTGRGIGPAYADKMTRSMAIRVGDLFHPAQLREKLHHIADVKNAMFEGLARLAELPFDPIDAEQTTDWLLDHAEALQPHVTDTTQLLHSASRAGKRILWEGANACMLDIDHGTFPFVTSSNCSSLGIYAGSGFPGGHIGRILGITKAYTTRVGGGPFPTELSNDLGNQIRTKGHEFGTTTGRPRRCGWLDLAVLKYSAMICGVTELGVMKLDVLAGLPTLDICTGYRHKGKKLDYFPADAVVLEEVEPIYETVEGFADDVASCRSWSDLPPAAQRYIDLMETTVGVPVRIVSVGAERTQTLLRR